MQGYDEGFAAIYSMRWTFFARDAAPRIQALDQPVEEPEAHGRIFVLAQR